MPTAALQSLETNARSVAVQAVDEVVAKYGMADAVRALAELANRGAHLGGVPLRLANGAIVARRLLAVAMLVRVEPVADVH